MQKEENRRKKFKINKLFLFATSNSVSLVLIHRYEY